MERALAFAVCLFAFAQVGGCGGGSDDDDPPGGGGGGGGGSDGMDGQTLSISGTGHPLNWLTTDPNVIAKEDECHTLINNHRATVPVPALVHDLTMRRCARGHSRHMRADSHDFFAHQNPEGMQPWDRLTANGVTWTTAGENLAAGYATAAQAVDGWLASPGHRANIENGSYGRTGIGYQDNVGGGLPYANYWTQKFAN